MSKLIYFDYAAATPLDPRVAAAMRPYESGDFYNPSALYTPARQVKNALEQARARVAQVIGAKPAEVTFTAGATESINLAIRGVTQVNPGKIIISAIEHEAVIAAAKASGQTVTICPVKPNGLIDIAKLEGLIDDQTVLVSIIYASNEIGTIQPLAKIGQLIAAKRRARTNKRPLYFHTDASQAASYLPLAVSRLGVDLLTLNGAKIYGPKQTGCLYIRRGINPEPIIVGGGQEHGLRSGTENVAGCIGFSKALELANKLRKAEITRLTKLRDYAFKIITSRIADVSLNGDAKYRLPNNLNLTIDGVDGETLVHHLDQQGILAATGAACSANKDQPSSVLLALGLNRQAVNSSLRITFGRPTIKTDIDKLVKILAQVVAQLRR